MTAPFEYSTFVWYIMVQNSSSPRAIPLVTLLPLFLSSRHNLYIFMALLFCGVGEENASFTTHVTQLQLYLYLSLLSLLDLISYLLISSSTFGLSFFGLIPSQDVVLYVHVLLHNVLGFTLQGGYTKARKGLFSRHTVESQSRGIYEENCIHIFTDPLYKPRRKLGKTTKKKRGNKSGQS